jgi:sugar/nucleoside kinase (ribokinase family)
MTFRGAAKQLSHKDIPFTQLEQVPAIHLSSIGNADLVREIAIFSKEKGIHLSWNPSAAELKDVVLQSSEVLHNSIQVVCVNDLEYEEIHDHQESLNKIATTIIVTKGKEGGEVFSNGSNYPYLAKPVIAVSELGAGDAFISGFVGGRLLKMSIEESILRGTQNAASVVQHLGAKKGLLTFSS